MHSHVIRHLDDHHLLNDAQRGFRKHRSCESQLILTVQDLAKGLNDMGQINAALFDLCKSFNKIPLPLPLCLESKTLPLSRYVP